MPRAIARDRLPYPVLLDNAMIRNLHIGGLHERSPAWRSIVALIETLRRERR